MVLESIMRISGFSLQRGDLSGMRPVLCGSEPRGPAVEGTGLHKSFGKEEARTDALISVDLYIACGEIVGILGPNGAGKTTLVSIFEGLVPADAGTARIFGEDVGAKGALGRLKHRLGIAMQHSVLPPLLHPQELLEFTRILYPQSHEPDLLIERLGLETKRHTQIRHLSGGQRQRVAVALALVGNPELVFLDEPTSQLDPQARRAVWDLLLDQRQRRDAAILVTTHQMEEAERLCDRVVILDRGRILAAGSPNQLIERYCPERRVEFQTRPGTDPALVGEDAEIWESASGDLHIRLQPKQLDRTLIELMAKKEKRELAVDQLRIESQNLEDVFLKITGRGISQ
jgi:ABC-2 type transport system ATP-binding protein